MSKPESWHERSSKAAFLQCFRFGEEAKATQEAFERFGRHANPMESQQDLVDITNQVASLRNFLANLNANHQNENHDWEHSTAKILERFSDRFKPTVSKILQAERDLLSSKQALALQSEGPDDALPWPHPHDGQHRLEQLPFAAKVHAFIDETGNFPSSHGDPPLNRSNEDAESGWAAVVVAGNPADHLPPAPEGFHAATRHHNRDWDHLLRALLSAKVGILGLKPQDLPPHPFPSWQVGVIHLIRECLWRVKQPHGQPVHITVWVEQHAFYPMEHGAWDAVAIAQLEAFCQAFPNRRGLTTLTIKAIQKDDHSHLAYADALAYLWGSSSLDARQRRQACALGQAFHTNAPAATRSLMAGAWTWQQPWHPGILSPLLHAPSETSEGGLAPTALNRVWAWALEHDAQATWLLDDLWRQHEEGLLPDRTKSLRDGLRRLQDAPELSPTNRLRARMLVEATLNHRGTSTLEGWHRLVEGAKAVEAESNAWSAEAHLIAAMRHFNRFEWSKAEELLRHFEAHEALGLGAELQGKLAGARGQAAAFQGQFASALRAFQQAQKAFQCLAKTEARERHLRRIGSYLRFLNLELGPTIKPKDVFDSMGHSDLPQAIAVLEQNGLPHQAFNRLALTRYLAEHAPEKALAHWAKRQRTTPRTPLPNGHPWCAIRLQEARMWTLLGDAEEACRALDEAAQLARGVSQGEPSALMQVYVLACGRLKALWGHGDDLLPTPQALQKLEHALPALPKSLFSPWESEAPLAEALPFYLR